MAKVFVDLSEGFVRTTVRTKLPSTGSSPSRSQVYTDVDGHLATHTCTPSTTAVLWCIHVLVDCLLLLMSPCLIKVDA